MTHVAHGRAAGPGVLLPSRGPTGWLAAHSTTVCTTSPQPRCVTTREGRHSRPGTGYTSIELKATYLRPIALDSGPLTCTGRVTKGGRRVAFADAEITDERGRTLVTATGACLVFPHPGSARSGGTVTE